MPPKVKYNGVRLQFQPNILLLHRCGTQWSGNSPGLSKPVLSPVGAAVTQRAGMAHWHNQKMPQISSGFSFPPELGVSSEMPETKQNLILSIFLWDRDGTECHTLQKYTKKFQTKSTPGASGCCASKFDKLRHGVISGCGDEGPQSHPCLISCA